MNAGVVPLSDQCQVPLNLYVRTPRHHISITLYALFLPDQKFREDW